MSNRVCTRFKDTDGLDLGCHLVTKEHMLEAYPNLVPWMKAPALWLWGCGNGGSLGNNSTIDQSSPVQTISGGTNWRSIDFSRGGGTQQNRAGIKTDGTLWVWGSGTYGRLGTNSAISQSSPVQTISGGTNWKSVSVGSSHTAAIKTDGTLWTWGYGSAGRLGNNAIISRSSPVQTISGGTNWKSVSAGGTASGAIKTDGTLWTWGSGCFTGNNSNLNRSSPVQTISGGTNWKSVSAGGSVMAAIKTDGTLWLWGGGAFSGGVLGDNSTVARSSPVQTVSGGTNWRSVNSSAAIKTDGTLWLWGPGDSGQLGNNSNVNRSSPVQTVSGGTNWRSVALDNIQGVAIKNDGTLWMWGMGVTGRLGNNSVVNRSSPVQTISGGTEWRCAVPTMAIRDEGEY